jgi:outer membrane protein OmpA-like peptidoglycan-associated protein
VSDTNTDIFRIKLPILKNPEPWVTVSGKIVDSETGKPVGAKIIYERLPDGKEMGIAKADPETGLYELRLPAGQLYGLRAEADGKISENQNLDLRNITSDRVIAGQNFGLKSIGVDPIAVSPIQENVTIVLNNVFFDFDKSILKEESYPELNRIIDLMMKTPAMQIEIAGHTDSVGDEQYNLQLSERRAKAVTKYLLGKGIENTRINTTFFGEQKPTTTNETPEGRGRNRRVEFKILKLK